MKNIIIYDKIILNDKFNKNKYNLYTKTNRSLVDIYNGKIINPPIFDKIIYLIDKLDINKLKMLYNMLNYSGRLFIKILSINIVKELNIKHKTNKTYIIIKRKDNIQYVLKEFRVVEFIIIGVQKGGTTALAFNISKHPDIYINNNKNPSISEVHFFDINWKNGIDYYKNLFDYSKKIVGEKTPNLLYLKYVYPLIQAVNPFVKLIICLRNPITRAYSHWRMIKNKYKNIKSFEEEIQFEIDYTLDENITAYTASRHFIKRGFYYEQLIELFKWFPRHNILILFQEELLKSTTDYYNKVFDFLNVGNFQTKNEIVYETENKQYINPLIYNKLKAIYKDSTERLEQLLNIKTGWND